MVAKRKVPGPAVGDLTHDTKNEPAPVRSGFAKEHLFAFVERVERMNEEIEALQDDRKEIYEEAKGVGFDVKVMRKVISARRMDKADFQEQEAMFDLYWSALSDADKAAFDKSVDDAT